MIYIKRFVLPEKNSAKNAHQLEHHAGLELLAKGLLNEYGLSFAEVSQEISLKEKGKPFLTSYPQIHFNISHSMGAAVCGISRDKIGVDIEKIRPVRLTGTRRILTKKELAYLDGCRQEDKNKEFFRFWTLKESYAKALGLGLSLDFTQIEFSLPPVLGEPVVFTRVGEEKESRSWKFFQCIWENTYLLSCCSRENLSDKEMISS